MGNWKIENYYSSESAFNYIAFKHQLLQLVSQNYKINITTSKGS